MSEQVAYVEGVAPGVAPSRVRRASWGAIFAGVFVGIILQLMLTLLGAALRIASLQPWQQPHSIRELATVSSIWLVVTGLISMWIGSWVAGRLCGGPRRVDGMVHGIVSWSVATVAALFLMATAAGTMVGGLTSILSGALSSAASSEGGQNKFLNPLLGSLGRNESPLPPTGRAEGQPATGKLDELAAQDKQLAVALASVENNGGASRATSERDQVIQILTTKHNVSQEDASNLLNQWDQQRQSARSSGEQKGNPPGNVAGGDVSQAAWWGFGALILGLLFAASGGWAGTASIPSPPETAVVAR